MTQLLSALNLKKLKSYADWKLLLFLLLFLNVKLAVKIPAIAIIYLLQFDFKFGFQLKNSRLPLFYPLIIIVALVGFVINGNYFNSNYNLVFITGIGFWLICILAIHQLKLSVEKNDAEVIHRTIALFFIINAVASLLNLAFIVLEIHALNPYTYQGQYQKYFISTGDFVKGITFDTSTTNAVLNAFGVIYFLTKKNTAMTLVCMATLLFTGSNFTNIFTLIILAVLFIFNSNRDQKSVIVICLMFLVIFMAKVSPQNNNYVVNTIKSIFYKKQIISPWPTDNHIPITQRADSTLNSEEKRVKFATLYLDSLAALPINQIKREPLPPNVLATPTGKIVLPWPDLNGPSYQWLKTTPPEQQQLVDFVQAHKERLPISGNSHWGTVPGKVTGLLQTVNFLKQHPTKIIAGDGIGNFSSKLAFRATGLKFTGEYPQKHIYINPDFLTNHLDIYLNFFSKGASAHSLTNSPFSVYDQLLAEYGLAGLLALFVCYLFFFAKHYLTLTYGIPLVAFVMCIFFIDYWFEQLSVVIFFELLLFLNIKEGQELLSQKLPITK
ncbi:MAG: hypothetical protein JWQ34_839 [Mucilaginibacter sp.]|uniref:hypothetical protein n=1 Tax=Mucilaginibacter sp. TaxID=1882438 RepID=UPI002601AB66|nr:hypothetical protein [Mucilaginibacter sp.]MDB5002614.1 hypothetical protein [Mucilaginibacter sp.]